MANLLEIGFLYKVFDMQLNIKKKCSSSNFKRYEVILVCCHGNEKKTLSFSKDIRAKSNRVHMFQGDIFLILYSTVIYISLQI